MKLLPHPRSVNGLAYVPNGNTLFTGDTTGTIRAWDLATEQQSVVVREETVFKKGISPLGVSPDGSRLALWVGGLVLCGIGAIPSPSNRPHLVVASPSRMNRFRVAPGWTLTDLLRPVYSVITLSPDWTMLAQVQNSAVSLRELTTGKRVATLARRPLFHFCSPNSPAFSADGKTLALSDGEGQAPCIHFWNVASHRRRKASIPLRAYHRPLYSPAGRWLALSRAAQIVIYEVLNGIIKAAGVIRNPHHKQLQEIAFSSDGKWLLTAGTDKVVRLWEVESQKLLQAWEWQIGEVTKVAFAPDGMTAAVAGRRRQVVVWDLDL